MMDLYCNAPPTNSGFEYNLAGEMAYFLYFRQNQLQRLSGENLWIKFRDGLILYYTDEPKTLQSFYSLIPYRLSSQWASRRNDKSLEPFLLYGPNKKVIPITLRCQKAIENLKEYRKTLPTSPTDTPEECSRF